MNKFYNLLAVFIILNGFLFSQVINKNNVIHFKVDLGDVANEYTINNGNIIFPNLGYEGKPGVPILPSNIFYIAIPPYSKVTASLKNMISIKINNVKPTAYPELVYVNDTTRIKKEKNLSKENFITDVYPNNDVEIMGYITIRDLYCAVVKVNSYKYNWKKNSVEISREGDIELNFSNLKPFSSSNYKKGEFDKNLSKLILNYDQAEQYRFMKDIIDTTGNWIDYTKEYIKIKIANDGIYRIDYNTLNSYGLIPSTINPKKLKIYLKGKEYPIYVSGEEDGKFDQTDYIEFYGESNYGSKNYRELASDNEDYFEFKNRYTDTLTYWLQWEGEDGLRIPISSITSIGNLDSIISGSSKIHIEKDINIWPRDFTEASTQLPQYKNTKTFFMTNISGKGSYLLNFNLNNIVSNSPIVSLARLLSHSSDTRDYSYNTGISLNNSTIKDSIIFNLGQNANLLALFNSSNAREGTNSITIKELKSNSNVVEQILVDWIDIDYYRYNVAQNDSIKIIIPDSLQKGMRRLRVSNFVSSVDDISIYKIKPEQVKFASFQKVNNEISFIDTVSGGDQYLVIKNTYINNSSLGAKKTFTNLRDINNGADYIIITNPLLKSSVKNYSDFISNHYQIRSKIVYTEDIFDEFGYGNWDPQNIKDFLKYAYNKWSGSKPSYLVLIGDGNYDVRNSLTTTSIRPNLVPTYGYPVSDVWYTMFDSSSELTPQMFVGRIPAQTNDQVLFYLNKHKTYVNRLYDEWNKHYILFSGGDENDTVQAALLKNVNDNIMRNVIMPPKIGGDVTHFYKTFNPPSQFGPYSLDEINNVLNTGGIFYSYIGHSATETWDNGILKVKDLKNSFNDRFPLITDFGCSTGKFAEPDVNAFGELFVCQNPDGQAIVYIANSSYGYVNSSIIIPEIFYSLLLKDSIRTVGEAHFLAKMNLIKDLNTVNIVFDYTNHLMGDPIIKIPIPEKENFVITPSSFKIINKGVNDQNDYAKISIVVNNYGLALSDSLKIKIQDIYRDSVSYVEDLKIKSPIVRDTILINIPVKNLPGAHKLIVQLDSDNQIDEIYKNDNNANFDFNVVATNVLLLDYDKFFNSNRNYLKVLNSNYNFEDNPKLKLLLSKDENFSAYEEYNSNIDTIVTSIKLNYVEPNKRYYWKAKYDYPNNEFSEIYSFNTSNNNYKWYADSLLDKTKFVFKNVEYNDSLKNFLIKGSNSLHVESAGSSDGKHASIKYNNNEMLVNTFFWGMVTARIDTMTFEPFDIRFFVYPPPASSDSMLNYLNTLPAGSQLIIVVSDDAAQSVLNWGAAKDLINAIKSFGSQFISNVKYRDSWCIIGKKGAPIGSVPEKYSPSGYGAVSMDTISNYPNGYFITPEISNSSKWDKVVLTNTLPPNSNIDIKVLGIKSNQQLDTLVVNKIENGVADISNINADLYDKIKLFFDLRSGDNRLSPTISNIGVDFEGLPEIAGIIKNDNKTDSLVQGDSISLSYILRNAGDIKADSIKYITYLKYPDNQLKVIDSSYISLNQSELKTFHKIIRTSKTDQTGEYSFFLTLDPGNKINEYYETNNLLCENYYLKKDTVTSVESVSLDVKVNNKPFINDQYLSNEPEFNIKVKYPLEYDIAVDEIVEVKIDNIKLNYNDFIIHYDSVNRTFDINAKAKVVDGNHVFTLYTLDTKGNIIGTPAVFKYFNVNSNLEVLNLYNYPNPFKDNTNFTFILTQVPEEIKINVYTVNGRLIRQIKQSQSDLNIGFNYIPWDGRDQDGDIIANNVYLYKVFAKKGDKTVAITQKMAKVK